MYESNPCKQMYEAFSKLLTNQKQKLFYDWMLTNGKEFKGRTLTSAEAKWLQQKVSRRLFTPKLCFLQSQVGAMDGELRYFEGQATTKTLGLPLEHAWLVDKEERVWDATWRDGDDYYGVEIPRDFIAKTVGKTRRADYLLGRYYGKIIEKKGGKK